MVSLRDVEREGRDSTSQLALPDAQPYTARLAGAGSLRHELEALLAATPATASPDEYRRLLLEENVTGKRSASGRLWAWKRLKLRYILDPGVAEFRAFRAAMDATMDSRERGLLGFLAFARTDRLFRDVTLECVSPYLARDGVAIDVETVRGAVSSYAHDSGLAWSASTLDRAHKHLLAALKDFGLIRGSYSRRTVHPHPGGPMTNASPASYGSPDSKSGHGRRATAAGWPSRKAVATASGLVISIG